MNKHQQMDRRTDERRERQRASARVGEGGGAFLFIVHAFLNSRPVGSNE